MADLIDNVRSWVKSRHRFFVMIEWPLVARSGHPAEHLCQLMPERMRIVWHPGDLPAKINSQNKTAHLLSRMGGAVAVRLAGGTKPEAFMAHAWG
jgi:hypothetical protein